MGRSPEEIEALYANCRANQLHVILQGLPPSVNKLYANVRGRRVKTQLGRIWATNSIWPIGMACQSAYGTRSLSDLKGRPLWLQLRFSRPSWRAKSGSGLYVRPDVSNFIKCAEDAFISALGLDDSAVVELVASKIEGRAEATEMVLTFL